jgi:hypothetical protein
MLVSKNNIDTGKILADFLVKNRISKAELGRRINRNGLSVINYTFNVSIQTGILLDICHAVKHNFFRDIADQLPEDFTKTDAKSNGLISENDQIIAALQEENKVLKIQNELLIKLKG